MLSKEQVWLSAFRGIWTAKHCHRFLPQYPSFSLKFGIPPQQKARYNFIVILCHVGAGVLYMQEDNDIWLHQILATKPSLYLVNSYYSCCQPYSPVMITPLFFVFIIINQIGKVQSVAEWVEHYTHCKPPSLEFETRSCCVCGICVPGQTPLGHVFQVWPVIRLNNCLIFKFQMLLNLRQIELCK